MSNVEQKPSIKKEENVFTFDFGKAEKKVKDAEVIIKYDNGAFLSNAVSNGLDKKVVKEVFDYTKAYNNALVEKASDDATKEFVNSKKIKKVTVRAGYGPSKLGKAVTTVYREKNYPVGGLGSGKTEVKPFVSYKVADPSLPSKKTLREKREEIHSALND